MAAVTQRLRQLEAEFDERARKDAERGPPVTRFPFNGLLSADEQRMADQHAFDEITP